MDYDITIVGSGLVGAVSALLIAKNTPLKIAILDCARHSVFWQAENYAGRVSAFSLSSMRILQSTGCSARILSKRVSPYTDMHVFDAEGKGELHFAAASIQEKQLGFIIEDVLVRESLLQEFCQYEHLDYFCPIQLLELQETASGLNILTNQGTIKTKCLIGADGANSWVRKQANIASSIKPYDHTAFIAHVKTERSHQMTAWQRFLSTGPLAFLPLADPNGSSIVWSATSPLAAELSQLDDPMFKNRLSQAFGASLGAILQVSARQSFALSMHHAKRYVADRIALIGDAAHTLHPLAGQGVNLGLLDAASLAEVIVTAVKKGRRFESLATLRRYERWRKGDTVAMQTLVDGLKHLFAIEKRPVPALRSLALKSFDQMSIIKNYLTNYAIGNRTELPSFAQRPPFNFPL